MKKREGIWYSDFYLSNGGRVRKSLHTTDKALAGHKERELQVAMEKALKDAPAKALPSPVEQRTAHQKVLTFKEAFRLAKREWEPWRSSKSPETIDSNFAYVTAHFKDDPCLSTINRDAVLDYRDELLEQGKSGSTINQRLSLISVLLKVAEDATQGKIQVIKMPRMKVRPGRIRILSRAEEDKVVGWFASPERTIPRDADMADLVVLLVDTGFRLSEALRIRSADVDWENEMVPAWENKADHPRLVPMTKRVQAILRKREKMEYPFGMFSKDYADDRWEAMRKGLKIDPEKDPEFVIHALRHTCASRLAAAGEDAFRIQKWMGHKTISTTQKYVTLFGKDLKGLAKTLDRVSGTVPKSVPKTPSLGTYVRERGLARRLAAQRFPRSGPVGDTVGEGLLIRRSLVRAQVGEPELQKESEEVPTNIFEVCPKKCAQK